MVSQLRLRGVQVHEAQWRGAEHNLARDDDERLTIESRANFAVDAGPGWSASGGRAHEVDFDRVHSAPDDADADPNFFSVGGAVLSGDVQQRSLERGGAKAAGRALRGEASGAVFRLAAQGDIHARYTHLAR